MSISDWDKQLDLRFDHCAVRRDRARGAARAVLWSPHPQTSSSEPRLPLLRMVGGEYLTAQELEQLWANAARSLFAPSSARRAASVQDLPRLEAHRVDVVGRVAIPVRGATPEIAGLYRWFLASLHQGFSAQGKPQHRPLGGRSRIVVGARKNRCSRCCWPVQRRGRACAFPEGAGRLGAVFQPTGWTRQMPPLSARGAGLLKRAASSLRLPDWWKARPKTPAALGLDRGP